jgi:hypothetical protein
MLWAAPVLRAGLIPITNGDFQTGPYLQVNAVSGWIVDHAYTWIEPLSAGSYYGLLNAPNNNPSEGQGAIHQILSAAWEPGTYELTLDVSDYYGFQGYDGGLVAQLRAGATMLGSSTYTPAAVSGGYDSSFHVLSVSFTLSEDAPEIGQPIGVYFIHTGVGGVFIDNVTLTWTAVPEPSTAILAIGSLGLLVAAQRRRSSQSCSRR